MKLLVFLFLTIMLVSSQKAYPPGLNFMMENIVIDKFREIIIPDVMEKFKTIKPNDISHKHSLYEIRIYNMEADITPLRGDQVQIVMNNDDNSLYAKVTDFEMHFHARAYGRALFVHAHGDARIRAKIDEFSFKIEPKLKADGDLNDLDYNVDSIKVDLHSGDIHMEHLSIGFLPNWLLKPIANLILDSCSAAYHAFEKEIDGLIVKILDEHRADIPDHMEIPGYPFSVSLSFPDVPQLYSDRVEVPFDGTVYVTSEGYDPEDDPAPAMPSYNPDNKNNIQVFLNQHMLKASFDAARRSEYRIELNSDTLKPLGLADDLMKVEYFGMLFPRMACHYDSNVPIKVLVGVDKDLNTDVNFAPDKVHGEFSPYLEIHAGDDVAFSISVRAIFDATVKFEVRDKETFMTGNLDNIDLADYTFRPGTVEDSDLGDLINLFKSSVMPVIMNAANNIINPGVTIPVFPLIKDMFEIDLEDIEMQMKDKYMEASFTLDIHQRLMLIQHLLKQSTA